MTFASGRGHTGLTLLRRAASIGRAQEEPVFEELELLRGHVEAGALEDVSPSQAWPEFAECLMTRAPARSMQLLRHCGALSHFLPEVEGLFGVPQIAEGDVNADLGELLMNALSEAAFCDAPLPVRFALMVMNVGKSDSPAEHLPVHYGHTERGRPRIEAICARFSTPKECLDVALLALAECERVHRVSRVRAGPVAAMLERLDAFGERSRFDDLMTVCACDFRAYRGRSGQAYPKAAILAEAIEACSEAAEPIQDSDRLAARARAIAKAFASERWPDAAT
jgi:tRNA nucleotidyltransferase (CCA-adding enzyme)